MADNENGLCMGCMMPLSQGSRCNNCGYDPEETVNPDYLPPHTALGERFLIGKLCATDPEGAWYVGYDRQEETRIWVREYMPARIAKRVRTEVQPVANAEAQYKALLSDFEDLCRVIARLSPTERVLPIIDIGRANNTVYAVYRYIKTMTLEAFLERSGGKLSWRHTKKLLMPLYHTVANIHKAGLIHRGLSPSTVLLDQTGALWLGSFTIAAARTNKSELSAQLFDGYSAPEQYALNSWQGTWTDVYALGAITYRTVTGETPPPALDRVYGDDLLDSQLTSADMTESTVNAINKALAFEVGDRIQTAEALVAELLATDGSNTAVYTAPVARKSFESADDSFRRQEIRDSASARALQDAEPPRTGAHYESFDEGLELLPPMKKNSAVARANARTERSARVAQEERKNRRKKGKTAHPVLSLVLSALVATALLGLGVYYLTTHFLSDLILAPASSQSESAQSGASDGMDYSDGAVSDDGKMPRFVGVSADSIRENKKLSQRFKLIFKEKYNKEYAAGVVYEQTPVEGTEMIEGSEITLFVSKGTEMVEMPVVVGMPIDQATAMLTDKKIKFDIIPLYDHTLESGIIVRCNTEPGVKVEAEGNAVMLFIKNETISSDSADDQGNKTVSGGTSASGEKDSSASSRKSSSASRSANKPKKGATVSVDENGNKIYMYENSN